MHVPLTPEELRELSRLTLRHYEDTAESFREGTRDHDVSQNIDALLRHIEDPAPLSILDLGCGPGRDLAAFRTRGHEAVGLDGAKRFVDMARAATGCEVLHQDFLALELRAARFHGVFANASLFHVPTQELARVLSELRASLVPRGVLFCSNPRGHGQEGVRGGRYGAFHDVEPWIRIVTDAGFVELERYYRPTGLPRAEQPWLATVWRRSDDRERVTARGPGSDRG